MIGPTKHPHEVQMLEAKPWYNTGVERNPLYAEDRAPVIIFHALSSTSSGTANWCFMNYFINLHEAYESPKISPILGDASSGIIDAYTQEFPGDFALYLSKNKRMPLYLWSHRLWGIHNHLTVPYHYITFLREPIITFVSREYFFHRMKGLGGVPDLDAIVGVMEDGNYLCQDLARPFTIHGVQREFIPEMAVPPLTPQEALRRARITLSQFLFVGIAEYFSESMWVVSRLLGLEKVNIWRRALAISGRPELKDLSPALIARIERAVAADIILYQECRKRFLELFAQYDFGSEFEEYKRHAEGLDMPGVREYWK